MSSLPHRPIAIANWKMHKTVPESVQHADELARLAAEVSDVIVLIAPVFTAMQSVGEALRGTTVRLAAQNMHWDDQGMFTGEVSPVQLRDVGCSAVIMGHSERRHRFFETDEMIMQKVQAALRHSLTPIFCIGETLDQRNKGQTAALLESQIEKGLKGLSDQQAGSIYLAYEPVWAIGTGQVATVDQIAETHQLIRKRLSGMFEEAGDRIPILYGGSVSPQNIEALAGIREMNGVLVGGASLKVDSFMTIIRVLAGRMKKET